MDITEKVLLLCSDPYWEIIAQCLTFACTILNSFKNMSHLLAPQKEEVKGGIQKSLSGKPGSSNANANVDRNNVRKNLNQAIEIINKCFNLNEAKCVQNIGLIQIQPLLNDFKVLYYPYVEVLIYIDDNFKRIILSEEPKVSEDLYFSLGNSSLKYKLKSDMGNFDKILLASTLIDIVVQNQFESLEKEHMELLYICCGDSTEFINAHQNESWLKGFQKMKEFLLVSICDFELCQYSLQILHNFLTAESLKFVIYEVKLFITQIFYIGSQRYVYQIHGNTVLIGDEHR